MSKAFMGVRLQRLREERGLTQTALARIIGISPSYLNQLERNHRPLTVPLLLRINATFGVDVQVFSEDDEARLPFFFVRVDRAGNMSKRQSATSFHFSRVGGTCPLWNVYEAFSAPGRILTQFARMPDGRAYLWIARTVVHRRSGFGTPSKTFAVGLGCDVQHAGRLVYSRGLALGDPDAATPIGTGCKVCERPSCPQRAFPPIGRTVTVDENLSRFEPYPVSPSPV